jgi:YesN/AraC family two-component response regulator
MIADDHPIICQALRRTIANRHPDWQVIGDAKDGIQLLEWNKVWIPT